MKRIFSVFCILAIVALTLACRSADETSGKYVPKDNVVKTPPLTPTQTPQPPAKTPKPTQSQPSRNSPTQTPPPDTSPVATKPRCDPNYSGCVPIASDVDCAGGKGNGPVYVKGPVRIVGTDVYDLDRDGDGIACE